MNRMTKFLGQLFLAAVLSAVLVNCGGNQKQVSEYKDPQVERLIDDATAMDYLIGSEQILRKASERDKKLFTSLLNAMKVNLAYLDEKPQDSEALQRLNSAIQQFQNIILTQRDLERIRPLFNQALKLLAKFAKIQHTEIKDIRWSLYSYRFSLGLGDFTNVIDNNNWKVRYVQQQRYLAAFGSGKVSTAVMLSPIYDFSKVKNLAYSMRHGIGLEDNPTRDQATRSQIMNNTFKVMISDSYKKGDAFDIKKFKRLPMGKLPTGLNFNTVDTGIISLSEYSGKKNVTLAIVYDQKFKLDKFSYISWSIERFNIYGLSDEALPFESAYVAPIEASLSYDFGKEGFTELQQITVEGKPGTFEESDHNGTKFIKMQNAKARGTQLLFSAPIDLGQLQKPSVQLEHTINFYNPDAQAKKDLRMVVAEYKEGINPIELEWKTLDFKMGPDGSSWDIFKTEDLELPSELSGKIVRFGWSHTARQGSTPVWQLISMNIKDLAETGAKVQFLEDDFSSDSGDTRTDIPADAFSWIYDFGEQGLSEMTQVTLAGAPGDFQESEHNGVKFIKMQARNVVGTKLLYSNPIDLKDNKEPSVQLTHTINFYQGEAKDQNDLKFMVAVDQTGFDPKDLTWETISFQKGPSGSGWDVYTSEDFVLPKDYQGKKIRLAWSHTAREGSTPVWQILSVNIKDLSKIGE